jgi:tetratricopeptide (TPR) repeat protein
MNRETILLAVPLLCAMAVMGWIVWSLRPPAHVPASVPAVGTAETAALPVLDEQRIAALRTETEADPASVDSRVALGDLYFDAHRFDQAIPWYEQALALRPDLVEVSTDLGVSYYYVDQPGRAVAQFERSLEVDPSHAKTHLNLGIVKAFGLQDLDGAMLAWERVIEIAPESAEAIAARDAIDRIGGAHAGAAS